MKALIDIQQNLSAPKNQKNKFGGYTYRSCEDILEAVKPLLKKHKAAIVISDKMMEVGGRVYVEATAKFICEEGAWEVTASAREASARKGMDDSQITGATSSYARKYALNGLLLIDDNKDADTGNTEAECNERERVGDLEKYRKIFKKSMKKYELAVIVSEFENDGCVSSEVDEDKIIDDLVGQLDSKSKLENVGIRISKATK